MSERWIRDALDEYADRHLPPPADPWPRIRCRVVPPARSRLPWRFPAWRHRDALIVLILVLVFATAGAAGLSRMITAQPWEPPRRRLMDARLMREVNQVQTVNGYTVTLRYAYADANVITLNTVVRDPAGGILWNVRPTWQVTDEQGQVFPRTFDGGTIEVDPGVMGQYVNFDAAGVRDSPAMLRLHVVLTVQEPAWDWQAATAAGPPARDTASPRAVTSGAAATATVGELYPWRPVAPPFSFDVAVPFVAGKEITPAHTVTAAGVPLTLRRIILTPAQTRVVLCLPATVPEGDVYWLVVADDQGQTRIGGGGNAGIRHQLGGREQAGVEGEHCGVLVLAGQELRSGTRTLRIKEMVLRLGEGERRLHGPWVFRYAVP